MMCLRTPCGLVFALHGMVCKMLLQRRKVCYLCVTTKSKQTRFGLLDY